MDNSIQGQLTKLFSENEKLREDLSVIQKNLLLDGGKNEAGLKVRYSHRDFVLRLGRHYEAIERLRDANDALGPEQKNYALSRAFLLYDKADFIDLEDEDLHAAFAAFVGLGLMSQADADAIMTPNEQA